MKIFFASRSFFAKKHYFTSKNFSFKKSIATMLIFALVLSQTVQLNPLPIAVANADRYRDIISIIVDKETDRMIGSQIRRYAEDIQNDRGSTRVIISIVDSRTSPAVIASHNEKLFYEGDGDEWVHSQLVGTVLIGNVPLPMVNSDGKYFPSVFPYVDFDNKAFVYNENSGRYEKNDLSIEGKKSVEIWHGVINPAVGREWNGSADIDMIRDFLDKTHNFYQKTGKFSQKNEKPKVLYFDAFSESNSIDLRSVFQYELWIKNVENLAYNRFSKYLLKDINKALRDYDAKNNTEYAEIISRLGIDGLTASNSSSDTISDDLIDVTPDIHTAPIIQNFVKTFHQILNKKILGESLASIYAAGRYNFDGDVNADLVPIKAAVADEVAKDAIKAANDIVEAGVNEFISSHARRIPIVDSMTAHYGETTRQNRPYKNYFFGKEASTITTPMQCTIARGSAGQNAEFGRSILVEANAAMDVNSSDAHSAILNSDAQRCYAGSSPALDVFWWGNSMLRVANNPDMLSGGKNPTTIFPTKKFTHFVRDIFSEGGMLETNRLPEPSLAQCMSYDFQYTVEQPHSWRELNVWNDRDEWITRHYPSDTSGDRFTCKSPINVLSGDEILRPAFSVNSFRIGSIRNEGPTNPIPLRPSSNFFEEAARYFNNSTSCLVGSLTIDGVIWNNDKSCIYTEDNGDDAQTVNTTAYRSLKYHTIEGVMHHVSPTESEITSADANGATPSLPIDINRSIEFVTKKGNIVKIEYPNFFRIPANSVAEMREWLRNDANTKWQAVLQKESETVQSDFDAKISVEFLAAKDLPQDFDWNNYISDEVLLQVLDARKWMHPNISKKYKDALESMLSYSGLSAENAESRKMPNAGGLGTTYDIAYLGLSNISPSAESSENSKDIQADYLQKISAIHALNISEQNVAEKLTNSQTSSSAQCGPIDGVDLFKWPGAVQCWIKSQLPITLEPGKCGADTIGYDPTSDKNKKDISNFRDVSAQKLDLEGARVIPHFHKKHMSFYESMDFDSSLQNDVNRLLLPPGSRARLEIISASSNGKILAKNEYSAYFSFAQQEIDILNGGAKFLLNSQDKPFVINAKIIYSVPLLDGSRGEYSSEEFSLSASSAYIDAYISSSHATGVSYIPVDSSEQFTLNFVRKNSTSDVGVAAKNISLKIQDDITRREIFSENNITNESLILPDIVTKNIGVYRAILTAEDGIAGEITFSVRSGELSKISLVPTSTAIIKDSTTLVSLLLQDAVGSSVAPDLYSVEIIAKNGSLIDASGNAVSKMNIDIFDSFATFAVRGDKSGKVLLEAKVSSGAGETMRQFSTTREIDVIPSANINFLIEGRAMQIGDTPRNVRVQIVDENNQIIRGFSSVMSISLPNGAGIFSEEIIAIENGQSKNFVYHPGTVAGQHNLTINIPGIGVINNYPITLIAGIPVYIDSSISDGEIHFWARDRYGNVSAFNGKAFLSVNSQEPREVQFENGKFSIPEENAYYMLEVPEIANNIIYYTEDKGVLGADDPLLSDIEKNIAENKIFRILPADKYTTHVYSKNTQYDFHADYNARYTVFAGGEFLREAEKVLYHSQKNNSQSLAATTSLTSPYAEDTIFTLFPGGGYALGYSDDAVLETQLNIERGLPVLSVTDSVRKTHVASVLYKMENAKIFICEDFLACHNEKNSSIIAARLAIPENGAYSVQTDSWSLRAYYNQTPLLVVNSRGEIETDPSASLRLKDTNSTSGLILELLHNGGVIAEILYKFSENESVQVVDDLFAVPISNAPVVVATGNKIAKFSDKTLHGSAFGISLSRGVGYEIFDSTKMGPSHIDDLGTLSENPWVGWGGDNRMLLSFAAGDAVGEATKWFHTYTMINLGDPVAHVDIENTSAQLDGIDRSIGTQIADSQRSQIHNFFEKDMNNDGIKDILVQYADGYMELLLNLGWRFRSVGNIAFLPRLTNSLVEVADFQWDKFSDIISLDDQWKLSLISNIDRKFILQEISVENGNAPLYIQQMKVYDMDADGKDDLVYLTSAGELGILYGTEVAGKFSQKILDSTLGITLNSTETDKHGGAIRNNFVTQFNKVVSNESSSEPVTETGITDIRILAEVYYQRQILNSTEVPEMRLSTDTSNLLARYLQESSPDAALSPTTSGKIDNTIASNPIPLETFIRSQYAELANADIAKKYSAKNSVLFPGDTIEVEISLKNLANESMKNVVYLDTIHKIFARDNTEKYSIEVAGKNIEKQFEAPETGEYALQFVIDEIPANSEAKIKYTLKVLPASYGEMLVGDFEKWMVGHDAFGDIAFSASNTCGAEKMTWFSDNANPREYHSDRIQATYQPPVPKELEEKIKDSDSNGVPDHVENMTPAQGKAEFSSMYSSPMKKRGVFTYGKDNSNVYRLGFDAEFEKKTEEMAQKIADGLSCGFGGGGCMSFPINWAPLAPGNDPVVFGSPIGDGFRTNEGLPFFSAMTTMYTPKGPIPAVWPPFPSGAGGYLGENAPFSSFVRMFATPTLTLGMGGAICLGARPSIVGNIPPKGLSPLIQWGNCIVMTKSMPICKGDGSVNDGDLSGISWLGIASQGRAYSTVDVWNGASCNLQASPTIQLQAEERKLESEILSYMKTKDSSKVPGLNIKISKRSVSSLNNSTPLINIGNSSSSPDFEVSISGTDNISDIKKVVDVNNKRISAFPDFIMNWLTRQTEELTNSLFTPPNLTIIPPTSFGQNAQIDGSYTQFLENLKKAYSAQSVQNMRSEMVSAYNNTNVVSTVSDTLAAGGSSQLGSRYANMIQSGVNTSTPVLNVAGGGINAMRSAYAFLWKLPFLNIRQTRVDINVPWILPSELDQYERKLQSYREELNRAREQWCLSDNSEECLKAKARINDSGLYSSIDQNLKRIEEYRRFPEKLQKYVTWKEKLLYDLLCNIQALEEMTFGWVRDNGVRFQKWAELYVLIKAIAESWQPVLDIFAQTNAQCGVCRNERHNAQKWKFKLISAIIPQIPVISFPKWPDIVLDLSDVRLGVDVAVPDFNFKISPLRLPSLPNLSLPNAPNINFILPSLPVLPALPDLPDLPDLPSLPLVDLPDLPPPPKLPKISGSIKASVDILKLISKMYCYYQNTVLIPEWQVGDVIAQRTERQGSLPMDFIDIQFPQFSIPEIKEIRVSTHLNYMLRSDFIAEYAKKAVEPLNSFSTDLQKKMPVTIKFAENFVNKIEESANELTNDLKEEIREVEESVNESSRNIQEGSDRIDNQFRQIESDMQNASDQVEENMQNDISYINASEKMNIANTDNLLTPIIKKLQSEKDVYLDSHDFAAHLKSQLIASGFVKNAYEIDKKMQAAVEDAKKMQKNIEDFNREKFDLLYKFVHEEKRKNGELQNIVDMLRQNDEKILAHASVGAFVSDKQNHDSIALAQLQELQEKAHESEATKNLQKISANDVAQSFQKRLQRIAQFSTVSQSNEVPEMQLSSSHAVNGYLPKFEGMYILTETQNIQTKLFDYTELIQKKDRVDVVDIDNDGDKDYVFVLGGNLYVKKTYLKSPNKIVDNKITKIEISDRLPVAPNNFDQILSTPSELNISFANTIPNETEWRLEFFDRYIEWDKISIMPSLSNTLPKTTVDLLLKTEYGEFESDMRSIPVNRYIKSGENSEWFVLKWPEITKLENDIFVSISPNRTIYTGDRDVKISYKISENSEIKNTVLQAHRAYQFAVTTEIRASNGPIYIIGGGTGNYRYTNADALSGLPILPGMELTSSNGLVIFDNTHRIDINIAPQSLYMVRGLGTQADRYNVVIPYNNWYYYARLHHLSAWKNDRAGIVLISPQAGSDNTGPVVTLGENIRIPVYAKQSITLKEVITELNNFSVQIDEDVSQDADGNGVYDDDFVSGNNSDIQITSDEIIFGAFTIPGVKNTMLKIRDEFGNTTYSPLSIEIFTPIPSLQSVSEEKNLSGNIDIAVENEPIDIFRIRASESPLMINKDSILTTGGWEFSSNSLGQNEEIIVTSAWDSWKINSSGVFQGLPNGFTTTISPASALSPMSINVLDRAKQVVYKQFISLPRTSRIQESHSSESSWENLLVTVWQNTKFVPASYSDALIPGGAYITDESYNALLVVSRDGNIYTMDNSISLELSEKDGNILIVAKKWGQILADFHYKMNFFYTTK